MKASAQIHHLTASSPASLPSGSAQLDLPMSRPVGKPRAAKPVKEKSGPSKSIDLSLKGDAAPLAALPSNFRDETDDLRKLNLSGQTRLGKELSSIRFAGETLTWLNLSGVDCSQVAACLWLKMLKTLFGRLIAPSRHSEDY